MEQETQITKWTATQVVSGKRLFALDAENNPYLLEASALLASGYQGKAFATTDPGSLTASEKGYWYHCGETGTFTHFDNLGCNKNDQLWWNGSSWDRIETGSSSVTPKFEAVASFGQTSFNLGVQLTADDVVQVNGVTLFSTDYSGVGTTTLNLNVGLDDGDKVIVIFS